MVLIGVILIGFQNCGEYKLQKTQAVLSIDPKASFCTSPSDTIQSNLKFIFIVDRSTSNDRNFPMLPGCNPDFGNEIAGTDDNGDRRFNAISNFVQNYRTGDDQFTYWSMINFADQARVVQTNGQDFTNNRAAFDATVNDQWTRTRSIDNGGTNYVDALDTLQNLLIADVNQARTQDPFDKFQLCCILYFRWNSTNWWSVPSSGTNQSDD